MQNLTDTSGNATSNKSMALIVKVCVVLPFFSVFLYCIVFMLHTFASHRQFLENSRYILFTFMLINDTLQLFSSVLLFLLYTSDVTFPFIYCAPLIYISTATYQNTPLILAAMSLERYAAILYPLHCPATWRPERIWVIILSLCTFSCIAPTVDFSLGKPRPGVDVFFTPVQCKSQVLNSSPAQTLFKVSLNGLCFVGVAGIIVFTYVRILLETRKMRQDRLSVRKALHTVLLHGMQLLLCMMALINPFTESLIVVQGSFMRDNILFLNYFCFILLPLFLSPLIYGVRDESLRRCLRGSFLCCFVKVSLRATRKPSPDVSSSHQETVQILLKLGISAGDFVSPAKDGETNAFTTLCLLIISKKACS